MNLKTLLAVAAITASAGPGHPMNTAYTERRERELEAQEKALKKRQRVREQIRARRAIAKAKGSTT